MKGVTLLILASSAIFLRVGAGEEESLRGRVASLEADNRVLREELRLARREAAEEAQKRADLQLAVAGILDTEEIASPARREENLLRLLNEIAVRGTAQALKTSALIRELREKYGALPDDSAERAEMFLKLDALERNTNALVFLLKPSNMRDPSETHILAVDRETELAILAVGSVHGVFPGMIYEVADSPLRLRVVSVRGFVSAAEIEKGDLAALNPGMRCFVRESRLQGQPFLPHN
ncbi:MAG: hypothetical protein MJ016_06740 [Victivallaceae bacterium]|nr:hypothetical protein [Victivallaceae bacterium]